MALKSQKNMTQAAKDAFGIKTCYQSIPWHHCVGGNSPGFSYIQAGKFGTESVLYSSSNVEPTFIINMI